MESSHDTLKLIGEYVAYVGILVSGIFSFVMSEIMEGTLERMCLRAARCALGIKESISGQMLFTTKPRVRVNERRFILPSNVKYLGVI